MADDVSIKYGSTGFEKIQGELKHLEKSGSDIPNWFRPAHRTLEEVGSKGYGAFAQLSAGIQNAKGHVSDFIGHLTRLGAVVTGVIGALGGVGVYAAARWTEGMLKATESNRNLEASLMGVMRNQGAVNKIMEFARGYAATSPVATYHEVLETMRELAYQPAFKPIMGDPAEMKRVMDVVQGLATMRPQEGIEGATQALRQAMSGVWVTMQRQYGIRKETLAAQAGMPAEEMEFSPAKSFKALEQFVLSSTQQTTNLTSVMKKLRESYTDWLETIGNAGIYDKALGYLQKLNESFMNLSGGTAVSGAAKAISLFLESIADAIARILTVGIDWDKIANQEDAMSAFRKLAENTINEFRRAWEENKDAINLTIKEAIVFSADVATDVGKSLGLAIWEGMREQAKRPLDIGFGKPALGGFVAPKWEGPTPWARTGISPVMPDVWNRMYTLPEYMKTPARPLAEAAPPLGLQKQFQLYGEWSKMAGALAEMPLETAFPSEMMDRLLRERKPMREKWEAGQMPSEEWQTYSKDWEERYARISRMDLFRGMQEKMLFRITETPEQGPAAAAARGGAYQQLFGISMARGDRPGAESYMEKALSELKKSFQEQAQLGLSIKENATVTKDNAGATRDNVGATKELIQAIKQLAGSGALNQKGESGVAYSGAIVASQEPKPTGDEIRYDVERGYTNY